MMETKARMRAAVFGICVNLCLFMVKLYVGISTNSISIYVDSLNNALDSVVCIIALVGFWLSVRTSPKKRANRRHHKVRKGNGKLLKLRF